MAIVTCVNAVSAADNDTIYVNTTGNDDSGNGTPENPYLTIKKGVTMVNANGTIHIANGTYSGSKNTRIQITKNMSIIGESQTGTIIYGTESNIIFSVLNGATLTIQNLTITNVTAFSGCGIYNSFSTCNVINCTFTGNTATSTNGCGGAIYNHYGTCNVNSCTFTNNTAAEGGAIYNNAGIYTVINCTFTNNIASRDGGAIYNQGTFTANFNRFYNNTSPNGNAIYNSGGTFDANNNWWGYNADPKTVLHLIVGNNVNTTTWVILSVNPSPGSINNTQTSTITADFNHVNGGAPLVGGRIPDGIQVTFTSASGSFNPVNVVTSNGQAISVFTPNCYSGAAGVNAATDYETANTFINVTNLEIYVSDNTGSDITGDGSQNKPYKSISKGISMLTDGGIIHMANGTYQGPNNTNITINKNMTIIGDVQSATIINGTGTNWIFTVNSNIILNIQNLTLTNTTSSFGGAINTRGTTTVVNCTFTSNQASQAGGAIYNPSGTCTVTGCSFTCNIATNGFGGAIFSRGNCNVTESTFKGNQAYVSGGAIYTSGIVNRAVTDCTFTSNIALTGFGGAICNEGSNCNVINSTFTGNTATSTNGRGGAIYTNVGTSTFNFNRIVNNSATTGNAIYCLSGPMNALDNWWGTNNPNLNWGNFINGFAAPVWWIYMDLTTNNTNPMYGDQVNLTANFNYHSNGTTITPLTGGYIPDSEVIFASFDGNLNPLSKTTLEGLTSSIFTPIKPYSTVNATLDYQTCSLTFNVDNIPTNLTITNLIGNKGQTVTLNATLTDYLGTPLNQKTVEFYIDNLKVGENSTDASGIATINYKIVQIGGMHVLTAKFLGDNQYAATDGSGTLKVNQSSIFVNVTASKTNPTVGETITLTFKLGNNGPDQADDVVFTYVIPEGMEFVSIETEPGYPQATYNPLNRTITWPLGTVPIVDPWIKLNVRILNSGQFNVNPLVATLTYDPTLGSDVQHITINAVEAASATSTVTSSGTIGMQETGLPINCLILAILAVIGGFIVPKRK